MTSMQPVKKRDALAGIAFLRVLVGFLGSKGQGGWWDSTFLDETGQRFLSTTFPRSVLSAGVMSTTEAAQKEHDQALGKRGCYHLFRLPIAIEDRLRATAFDMQLPTSQEEALKALSALADGGVKAPTGPVQIGVEKRILTSDAVSEIAAHYHSAFVQGIRCYPYFQAENS
jgi:hypothetical protein